MIEAKGILTVRIYHGRYGDFRVGRLITSGGQFIVKDRFLDQYDEGRYEGDFIISKIFSSSYSASGRLVIEIRAQLKSFTLAAATVVTQNVDQSLEQDPLEEEVVLNNESADIPDIQVTLDVELPDNESSLSDLFGFLWPLTSEVKLDATVSRKKFRLQRDQLKALGYAFKPVGQLWIKTD